MRLLVVVPFVLELVLAVALIAWLLIRNGERAIADVTGQLRQELTERVSEYVLDYLETPHQLNELNARAISTGLVNPLDARGMSRHLWLQIRQHPSVAFVYYASRYGGAAGAGRIEDGRLVVDTSEVDPEKGLMPGRRFEYLADESGRRGELLRATPGFDARERPWFQAVERTRGAVWTDVYSFFAEGTLAIAAARPLFSPSGDLVGVLGADLTLDAISQYLRDLKVGISGKVFIFERSGLLVASSLGEPRLKQLEDGSARRRLVSESNDPLIRSTYQVLAQHFGGLEHIADSHQLTLAIDGASHFLQVAPLFDPRGIDWLVVTVIPATDFMEQIDAGNRLTLIVCGVAFLLALASGLLTARWITRPMTGLNAAAQAIAKGDWDQDVPDAPFQELDQLSRSFNEMASQLEGAFRGLESRVEKRTAQLVEAKEAADRANQAKSDFLADMSHDIRTPLAAILGYVELLGSPDLPAEQRQNYLRTVRNNGNHLNQLLSDLLDIRRIEEGGLELNVGASELSELLAQLESEFSTRASEKGLTLEIISDGWLPWRFNTDAHRLHQVVSNLLSNAIKFTEHGWVTLTLRALDGSADSSSERTDTAELEFSVHDTGPGLRSEKLENIFQRFVQTGPRAESKRGFGLGLFIVRQLTELMAGEVAVTSEVGRGSTFSIRLRVDGCTDWARRRTARDHSPGIHTFAELPRLAGKVLIVDDSQALRVLCEQVLLRWGLECVAVADGGRAVEAVDQEEFDVVLMDWQMAGVDGLEATARLRRMGKTMPIVALTAAAMSGDRERCLAAGCDDYLAKPIDFKALYRLLRRLLGFEQLPTPDGAPSSAHGAEVAAAGEEDGAPAGLDEINELKRAYARGLSAKLATLRAQAEECDWGAFNASVHRLVGTSGTYGFRRLFTVAEELESAGKRRDDELVLGLLARLRAEIETIADAIRLPPEVDNRQ